MSLHRQIFREHLGETFDVAAEDQFRWCFDLFGGGSEPAGQATTTISNRPFPAQENALSELFPEITAMKDIPVEYPDFPTVVPFSGQTEQALQGIEQRAIGGSDLNRGAQDAVGATLRGDYLNAGNPHFGAFADRVTGDIGSRINAQFAKANRLGSPANAEAMTRGIGDVLAPIAYQNYANERTKQMQAAEYAPQLAQTDYADLGRLLNVGGAREQQFGADLQDQISRFNFEQQEPRRRLAEAMALIGGGQYGGTQTTNAPIYQNSTANTLGGLASLASIGGSLFGSGGIFGR